MSDFENKDEWQRSGDQTLDGGKHVKLDDTDGAEDKSIPAYELHSKRMRKNLFIVILVLLALVCALVVGIYFLMKNSENVAVQQAQITNSDSAKIDSQQTEEDARSSQKTSTVPNLVELVGLNVDQAIEKIGHGAQISSDVLQEGDVRRIVKVNLSSDEGDSKNGSPNATFNLNADNVVISVSYFAPTKSLGFGSVSFIDVLNNEGIFEKTLSAAGLLADKGVAVISPDVDRSGYSTYGSDGTTLLREDKTFEGAGKGDQEAFKWKANVVYDYSVATATDNLSDTIRTISITISK